MIFNVVISQKRYASYNNWERTLMTHIEAMLKSHPVTFPVDLALMTACVEACLECVEICNNCADACLSETHVASLVRCIRTCLDCAEVCSSTAKILSRLTETDWLLLRSQLQTCAIACKICAAECESHAPHHEHCRICGEVCRECEETCRKLLLALPA